jgi:hypothetical protein
MGTDHWVQYMYLWAAVQELERVAAQARSFDTFHPPLIAEFIGRILDREDGEAMQGKREVRL